MEKIIYEKGEMKRKVTCERFKRGLQSKRKWGMRFSLAIISVAFFIFLIININLITAQTWPSFNVCCEKTKSGAWCQNTLETNCDVSIDSITGNPFRVTPTSCEATSFCKPGCCVDSEEGLCMENTPERVCKKSAGTWLDDEKCMVNQCDLGCCVLGDQASFVTLTRCKRLSGIYGLETNFQLNVPDEASCVLIAHYQDKGACVYEFENQRTCKFTTREECLNIKGNNITSATEFHNSYLCSADELATNCGPTKETMCVDGKEEVYFKDSCGNRANIYDASKTYDKKPSYWQKIVGKEESCNSNSGNINSKSCGNCNYFKGSICSKGSATYGDYNCRDLNCYDTENGNDYKNGESWCIYQGNVGLGRDSVGSRHFRHLCINGEELVEPCADYRNEICFGDIIKTDDGNFREAGCIVNRWTDCVDQTEEEDCLNGDKRDCYWKKGVVYNKPESSGEVTEVTSQVFSGGTTGGFSGGVTGNSILDEEDPEPELGVGSGEGACLPNVPIGLKFWEEGESSAICSLGNSVCIVDFEVNIFEIIADKRGECVNNCHCLNINWIKELNNYCTSLGDCGAYVNLAGKSTDDGADWKISGEKQVLKGLLNEVKTRAGV